MKRLFSVLLFFTMVMCGRAQWPGPHSRVETDSVRSETLDAFRAYTVYLPADFDSNTAATYPVLYLLHGMGGVNTSWFNDQRVGEVMDQLTASGEAVPMIIVSPDAGGDIMKGHWNGYFNMPGWNYEDFFFNEFVPYIEKKYRCGGAKERRAIAGLSMGGGGSTSYAQRHPEMFSSCYAMSALMDIPDFPSAQNPGGSPDSKMALLTKAVKDLSCTKYVAGADDKTKDSLRGVKWFVDCGDDDFLLDRNIEFMHAMRAAGIPMQFRVRDGGHTNEYWHTALFTALPFVSRNFSCK